MDRPDRVETGHDYGVFQIVRPFSGTEDNRYTEFGDDWVGMFLQVNGMSGEDEGFCARGDVWHDELCQELRFSGAWIPWRCIEPVGEVLLPRPQITLPQLNGRDAICEFNQTEMNNLYTFTYSFHDYVNTLMAGNCTSCDVELDLLKEALEQFYTFLANDNDGRLLEVG